MICLLALDWGWTGSARAEVQSELRLQSESFLSPTYSSTPQTNYQSVNAAFKTPDKAPDELRMDVRGSYSFGAPLLSTMNIREFQYHTKLGERQTFSMGRRLQTWNELDRRWNFGVIEPVFKINPLSPERQGLTGLFWDVQNPGFQLSLFGSFFYLPDQGPSFELNGNGEFVRGNPWFRSPPQAIRVMSEVSQVEYRFQRPNETQIVLQPSYGARLEVGDEWGWKFRASQFYKPMNQLALGYDGQLDIPRDRGVVDLQPQVVFHSVSAADVLFNQKTWRTGFSGMWDRPAKDRAFDDRWTSPLYSDAVLGTAFVDWIFTRHWKLSWQAMAVSGGEVTETGALASSTRAPINSRYPFHEAQQIGLETQLKLAGQRTWLRGSYAQSERDQFRWVRAEGRVDFQSNWILQGEMQLVDGADLNKDNRNEISAYRDNDRISVGVGYAF